MATRLYQRDRRNEGLKETGLRVVNHGVAGGLLLAQYGTTFYALTAHCQNAASPTEGQRRLAEFARSKGYKLDQWWRRLLWVTAATALHDVMQQHGAGSKGFPEHRRPDSPLLAPLTLEDDPLAFLGVLVDSVQCWDRYPVVRLSGRQRAEGAARMPVESRDVRPFSTAGRGATSRPRLRLPREAGEKAKKELDAALSGWSDVLDLSVAASA